MAAHGPDENLAKMLISSSLESTEYPGAIVLPVLHVAILTLHELDVLGIQLIMHSIIDHEIIDGRIPDYQIALRTLA